MIRYNERDNEYKDKVIDLLERLEMIRNDIECELVERKNKENISFLTTVLNDINQCILHLYKYREE